MGVRSYAISARREVREQADKINIIAEEMHSSGYDTTRTCDKADSRLYFADSSTGFGAQSIAAEMVASFLLPEVKKQSMRQNVAASQRKYLQAAHNVCASSSYHVHLLMVPL